MSFARQNQLLSSLTSEQRELLLAQMESVELPSTTRLYQPQQEPAYAHFLTEGVASIVTFMLDGRGAEVAMVGCEGVVESLHLLGDGVIPTSSMMQVAGRGLRISFPALQAAFASSPALRGRVLRFAQMQASIMGRAAGCHRLHRVEARLALWLLMIEDRVGRPDFHLMLEFMAEMIGAENHAASRAAQYLQGLGLIKYFQGDVEILRRDKLIQTACECYPLMRRLLDELYLAPQ